MQNIEQKIEFWKNHNLHNYIKKGNKLNITQQEIGVIEDWLRSEDSIKHRRQIQKLSVEIALNLACAYKIKKRDCDYTNIQEEVLVNYEFSNGFKIVQLLKKSALNKEAKFMRNCLAKFEIELEEEYYSLRDSKNRPHATINVCGKEVVQIKGFANSVIKNCYFDLIMEWIDYKNLIIVEPNNFYYLNAILINNKELIKVKELSRYENVVISHGLNIHDVKYNVKMPNKMIVVGDVTFTNLKENVIFPEELIVYGNLTINNCSVSLIKNTVVHGYVEFIGCSLINGFGSISCDSLLIADSIADKKFTLDTTTPSVKIMDEKKVKEIDISNYYGAIEISMCDNLLKVSGENCRLKSISIDNCKKIKEIPSNVIVDKVKLQNIKITDNLVFNNNWGKINLLSFNECCFKKFNFDFTGSFFKITFNKFHLESLTMRKPINVIEVAIQNSDKLNRIELDFNIKTLCLSGMNVIKSIKSKADCLVLKDCINIDLIENRPKNNHSLEINRSSIADLRTTSLISWLNLNNSKIGLVDCKLKPQSVTISNCDYAILANYIDLSSCQNFILVDRNIKKIDKEIMAMEQIDLQCPNLEETVDLKAKVVSVNKCDSLKKIGENSIIIDYLLLSKKQNLNLILKTNELFVKKQIGIIKYTER